MAKTKVGKAILLIAAALILVTIYFSLTAKYPGYSAVIGTTTTIYTIPSHTIIVGGISNANMNISIFNQSFLNQLAQLCAESKIGGQTAYNINYCALIQALKVKD
ncbi:MAG: hypothetical protein QW478_06100 [Candidatus Micrarchaeaceae archaeon]